MSNKLNNAVKQIDSLLATIDELEAHIRDLESKDFENRFQREKYERIAKEYGAATIARDARIAELEAQLNQLCRPVSDPPTGRVEPF